MRRVRRWLGTAGEWFGRWRPEHWMAAAIALLGAVALGLILLDWLALYGGDIGGEPWDYSNRLYLLSSIAQALAAILALLVTLTLVATQLAAQAYSPRVVALRLRDPWLWSAIIIYVAAILWALFFHGQLDLLGEKSASIALWLAGLALLYLVPFTLATLRSLDPAWIARRLAAARQDEALDDMIRKAAQEDQISVVKDVMDALKNVALQGVGTASLDEVNRLSEFILKEGRYLLHQPGLRVEGFELAISCLTDLAIHSRQAKRPMAATIFEGRRTLLEQELKEFR